MPVKVKHENSFLKSYSNITENCIGCEKETRFWWGDGCCPLCIKCSQLIDYEFMKVFCQENGYGPIPKKEKND